MARSRWTGSERDEADYRAGKISINSPIARALIGKLLDDVIEVATPGGVVEYEISKIEYK